MFTRVTDPLFCIYESIAYNNVHVGVVRGGMTNAQLIMMANAT